MEELANELKKIIMGTVSTDEQDLIHHAHDASIFELKPIMVIYPENSEDIQKLVSFISYIKKIQPEELATLSLTVWSGGTDLTGGPLTSSICIDMKKCNHIEKIGSDYAAVEPGVLYKELEKEIQQQSLTLPISTATTSQMTLGGMVGNNAGGEKSYHYGKTNKFIRELTMVLKDGKEYTFKKIDKRELDYKTEIRGTEGEIYESIYNLIRDNFDLIQAQKPRVSYNSSGYAIWDVWDPTSQTFDLTQLFAGAQGTLGIQTNIKFSLVPVVPKSGLLIVYMRNFEFIPEVVTLVSEFQPVSFEFFDAYTLDLALKSVMGFAPLFKRNKIKTALEFLPEMFMSMENVLPKLTLLIEFEEQTQDLVERKILELQGNLSQFQNLHVKQAESKKDQEKNWAIHRESFNLFKHSDPQRKACPFIDDVGIPINRLAEFFTQIYTLLNSYHMLYTISGHLGSGNIHILPLLDMKNPRDKEKLSIVQKAVYDLTLSLGGTLSGEHNDGLLRSPFLKRQFGDKMYEIFNIIKHIFDPENIFNTGKKAI